MVITRSGKNMSIQSGDRIDNPSRTTETLDAQVPSTSVGDGAPPAVYASSVSPSGEDDTRRSKSTLHQSSRSVDTVRARKLAAEAQHARRLADLELAKLAAERNVELAKLAAERNVAELEHRAELAAIQANSSRLSSLSRTSSSRSGNQLSVEKWLHDVQVDVDVPEGKPSPIVDPVENSKLIQVLENLANKPNRGFDRKLPTFNGKSPTEWLAFKRLFLDTQSSYTAAENLARLNAALCGAAREAVYVLLVSAHDPEQVLSALEMRFGRPEKIVLEEISVVRGLPKVGPEGKDLVYFTCRVRNCIEILKLLNQTDYLRSPEIYNTLLSKLSPLIRARWYDYAGGRPERSSKLEMLSEFLSREVELQTKFGLVQEFSSSLPVQHLYNGNKKISIHCNSAAENINKAENVNKFMKNCLFCNKFHDISKCQDFLSLSIDDRWQWIKNNKVCYRCLRNSPHKFKFCKIKSTCRVEGCSYKHHTLLHNSNSERHVIVHIDSESVNTEFKSVPSTSQNNSDIEMSAHAATTLPCTGEVFSHRPILKVVAVTVYGPFGSINCYALLDDGCTATFIDTEISNRLGLEGPSNTVRIDCVGGLSRDSSVNYVNFMIKGRNCTETYQVRRARSINNLGLAYRPAVHKEAISKYSYLTDLTDVLCFEEAKPMLIIGVDNWHLMISTSTRSGTPSQPVAIQTALGWVLYGFASSRTVQADIVNNTVNFDYSMETAIKEYFKLDSIGILKKDYRSTSDVNALKILKDTTRRLPSGRFETGLLWRADISDVPNNYKLALSRFLNLEKKMKGDAQYRELYSKNIHAMLDKRYAEECVKPPEGITWYLPHFGVTHPNKPGKLRIVHDAAAKYNGVSLNSFLLPGPDLLQPLLPILMRFRENPIAITADIKEMFSQVHIRPQDRNAQRFIWRDNPSEPFKVYRMASMIFGACSSPSTALYIKNLNATEYQHEFPDAAHASIFDVYMDDYIGSHENVEKAARIASDIISINRKGCFEMCNWISNDPAAISLIPKELRSSKLDSINLGSCDTTSTVRTLGLIWQPVTDEISFNNGLKDNRLPNQLTKRDVLSHVMRVYDPLGILGPIVSRGRIMFQTIWRKGLTWDEKLSQTDHKQWIEWFEDLLLLSELKIPRCYSLSKLEVIDRELHLFCDASELAYAAVAYWRFVYSNNEVKLALIGSKSRVAPLKPCSIPRLELQGALVAARFATFIAESHKYKPTKRVFWCDSQNVLSWLRSDARSFKPFVAHRIGEILELTEVTEWRWVPSLLNVADDATRLKRNILTQESRWIVGPEFLFASQHYWPSFPLTSVDMTNNAGNLELKPFAKTHCHFISETFPIPLVVSSERLSSWIRLVRATARVHKFITLIRNKDGQKYLTAEDLSQAETLILRKSQIDSFPEDIQNIMNKIPLPRKSRLYNLSPFIDEDQVIRLGGRVDNTPDIGNDMKHPIILDAKHQAVRLLISHYHKKAAHAHTETVVNEMRQIYWIINLRSAVRSIAHNCQFCRLRRAKPLEPPMGDLPLARLTHHRRPFTFTGLDYFGPLQVAVGRRREKRYIALYTCLVTRAVHLEVVYSLSSDAAIMSIRRFIARRGTPSEIWSDNGTAFVGANRILKSLYGESLTTFTSNEKISWKFIPPASPFMGGAWERLVRSIKTALKVTLKERFPTDEVLQTLILEAEALVNARPLTHVSSDPECNEALTPFHFLIGSSSGRSIPATMTDRDLASRSGWRKATRLLDFFWNRWVREYLPILLPRRGGGMPPRINIGDLVLIVDNQLPRGSWPRGRVVQIFYGKDQIARVAEIKTSAGLLKRPMKKIIPLL